MASVIVVTCICMDERICAACTLPLDASGYWATLPSCVHEFHTHCIARWSRESNTCPNCAAYFRVYFVHGCDSDVPELFVCAGDHALSAHMLENAELVLD